MEFLIGGALTAILLIILAASWRSGGSGVEPWMLRIEGLTGLCSDYLALIEQMQEPGQEYEIVRYLDAQRQVTHNQILTALRLDRSYPLDMAVFARRYLRR
jgi:hypothetical protein